MSPPPSSRLRRRRRASEPAPSRRPGRANRAGGPDRVAEYERVGSYGTKGVAAPGNVPGGAVRGRHLARRGREPLALRWGRLRVERRLGKAERPLEVGRRELDVGERTERDQRSGQLRNEGRRRALEPPSPAIRRRRVGRRHRELLALRRRPLQRPVPGLQRPLEMGRDELDLGERPEQLGRAGGVRHERSGGAGDRPGARKGAVIWKDADGIVGSSAATDATTPTTPGSATSGSGTARSGPG